jgi:uncharacterized protein (TIGR02266 family)
MNIENQPETRSAIRLAIFNGAEQQQLMNNYSVNLNTGGVYIETIKVQPVDTPLTVEFMLPNSNRPITCKARVAWVNEPGGLKKLSLPPGMGLQFVDLSLEDIQLIRNFLKDYDVKPIW